MLIANLLETRRTAALSGPYFVWPREGRVALQWTLFHLASSWVDLRYNHHQVNDAWLVFVIPSARV